MDDIERFYQRIGKKIYRGPIACECKSCKCVEEVGVLIMDKQHAYYLHTCHMEMGIKYRDCKPDPNVRGLLE